MGSDEHDSNNTIIRTPIKVSVLRKVPILYHPALRYAVRCDAMRDVCRVVRNQKGGSSLVTFGRTMINV